MNAPLRPADKPALDFMKPARWIAAYPWFVVGIAVSTGAAAAAGMRWLLPARLLARKKPETGRKKSFITSAATWAISSAMATALQPRPRNTKTSDASSARSDQFATDPFAFSQSPSAPPVTSKQTSSPATDANRPRPKISYWLLLKTAGSDWLTDNAPRLGAALAYYTVFSIAPLLVIAVSIAGFIFGTEAVTAQLERQLQSFLGAEGAAGVQAMIAAADQPKVGILATVLGLGALLLGATGVFGELKSSLSTIWEVEAKPGRGILGILKDRFLSFAMVLGVAFLLLVSLVVSAFMAAATQALGNILPGPDFIAHAVDLVVTLGVVTLLFALIFKYLPDVKIAWRDVWLGAAVTAVLFTLGKYAIGVYLGTAGIGSAYGAAGSLVIVLIWAYYSAQILFFGAELTQVYARLHGSDIQPSADAVRLGEADDSEDA